MKSASAAPGDPARTALDWPFHAGIAADLAKEIRAKARRREARRRRAAAGAAAILALAGSLAWGVPFVRETSRADTHVASRRTLALSDGSTVELNAQTRERTDFRYGRRRVEISRGEAFFSVAKDPKHPFSVVIPEGEIQVLGTRFDVRLTDDGRAEVTLLEGSIEARTSASGTPTTLSPGDQLSLGAGMSAVRKLSPRELDAATDWRDGRLVLNGRTLGDIASRLASFHGVRIAVDPDAAALEAGGVISLSNLRADLGALEETLPIRVRLNEDGSYRLARRQP